MSRRVAKGWPWLLVLVLIFATSTAVWGEINLRTGEAGEASWWFFNQHMYDATNSWVCGTEWDGDACYATYGDQWSVELATYFHGDWAYMQLDAAMRFTIDELTAASFDYRNVGNPGVQSGPSMALWLFDPVSGTNVLAISVPATAQSASCTTYDAYAADWYYAPVETIVQGVDEWPDPATFDTTETPNGGPVNFAALVIALTNYKVKAALALMNVVGDPGDPGVPPFGPVGTGQVVVDDVTLLWTTSAVNYGGIYNLEPAWDPTVGFDDWTQTPLPTTEPPREWDKWCTDSVDCPHCLDVDDQNLWNIIKESDLDGLDVPVAAKTFPTPPYAIYFGNPTTGNYDMGEAAVGAVCSPWNQLNPGDKYVTLSFEYFREVEQYMGKYDWTYVQILFDDWTLASGQFDPLGDEDPVTEEQIGNNGNCEDWETVWYKDSKDANEGDWTKAVITHYIDANGDPYNDDAHRILIPTLATKMRIRFVFNSVDGASNDYFGWAIDNIVKEHTPDPNGCRICIDYLPQGEVGEKYDEALCPQVLPNSTTGARAWEIKSVVKDGQRTTLPRRLALDPMGRLYGELDAGTAGTYEITFRLICWVGRPVEKTIIMNIRAPSDSTAKFAEDDFDTYHDLFPTTAQIPVGAQNCPNLWHETSFVKYALDGTAVQAEYGDVAYFGKDDSGAADDPNFKCGRAKGCIESVMVPIGADEDGQELIIGFKSWRNVECSTGEYDRAWVDVRTEAGEWKQVWYRDSNDCETASWRWEEAHTGITLHKGKKVQVRFCFDSVDGYKNGAKGEAYGWLVDEISLYAGATELSITSCPPDETSLGEYYKEQIQAAGGGNITPVWEIASGELPPGLGLVEDTSDGRKAFIEGTPREAGTFEFTIRVRDVDWEEAAVRTCTITVTREVSLLCEDFESDPGWGQGGLWHFTTDGGVKGVPNLDVNNHAAYFGQNDVAGPNYNTGARASGMLTLVTPVINLTGIPAVLINFDYWRSVENFGQGGYDKTYIEVKLDGGAWHQVWYKDSADACSNDWIEDQVPAFATNGATTMVVRFVFDSMDKWYNNYTGWLIDNLCVISAPGGVGISTLGLDERATAARGDASAIQVMNIPNPVKDVHTTTFVARGVGIEALRIEVYDLAGTLVYNEETAGSELVWHTENDFGEYLANGVYTYRALISVDGRWIATKFQKLVILR